VVLLTLMIGVLNVCLGYAAAVLLGWGPPGLLEAWEALTTEPAAAGRDTAPEQSVEQLVQELVPPGAEQLEDMLDEDFDQEPADELHV